MQNNSETETVVPHKRKPRGPKNPNSRYHTDPIYKEHVKQTNRARYQRVTTNCPVCLKRLKPNQTECRECAIIEKRKIKSNRKSAE